MDQKGKVFFLMDTTNTERFPFDYDSLGYGYFIPVEDIERITGVKRDEDPESYRLKMLGIKEQIGRELFDRKGILYTICTRRGAIRILTALEASEYNEASQRQGIRKTIASHQRSTAVDSSGFTKDQKIAHNRRVEVSSRYVSAIAKTRNEIKIIETKRKCPGLIEQNATERRVMDGIGPE